MRADRAWLLAFVGYFAVQMVLRMLIGPGLELDEAEAILDARSLAWGYGPQPPLYSWLQWTVFQATGPGIPGLAVLKAALLAGTLAMLYLALRRAAPPTKAGVATLANGLLPQLVWESQRSLTHTVLATFLTAVALHAFLRALGTGRWRDHAWLGVALGLGALAKLNFLPWAAGITLAAAILPEWRARLRPTRLILAAGAAAAMVAPNAVWMARNPDLALASVRKFEMAEAGGLAARLAGTASLLAAVVGFMGLAALVLGLFAWRAGRLPWPLPPLARLLALGAALPLVPIWIGVLTTGATNVNDRWLMPVSWMIVPAAVLALWGGLSARARRGLEITVAATWVVAMAGLPYASLVDPGYRGSDFRPAAARLVAAGAPGLPVYVAHLYVAGNLLNADPRLDPTYIADPADVPDGPAILVVEFDGPMALDPAIEARVERSFEMTVPRGRRGTTIRGLVLR